MESKRASEKSPIRTTNTVTVTAGGVALESFDRQLLLEQLKKLQTNSQKQKPSASPAVTIPQSKS